MEIVVFIDTGIRTTFSINEDGNLVINQGYDEEWSIELTVWHLDILENYLPEVRKQMLRKNGGEE
jgi:hypothetical protein